MFGFRASKVLHSQTSLGVSVQVRPAELRAVDRVQRVSSRGKIEAARSGAPKQCSIKVDPPFGQDPS